MVEGADTHFGAAADERLQSTGAALHVGNLDFEARVLEVAEPLGDRERQIEDRRLAANRESQLRHLRFVLRADRRHQHDGGDRNGTRRYAPHIASLLPQDSALTVEFEAIGTMFEATTTRHATEAPC